MLWKRLGTTHRDLRYSEPGCGRVSAPPAGAAGALAKGYLAFESAYLRGERSLGPSPKETMREDLIRMTGRSVPQAGRSEEASLSHRPCGSPGSPFPGAAAGEGGGSSSRPHAARGGWGQAAAVGPEGCGRTWQTPQVSRKDRAAVGGSRMGRDFRAPLHVRAAALATHEGVEPRSVRAQGLRPPLPMQPGPRMAAEVPRAPLLVP